MDLGVPVGTAVIGWFGNTIKYRHTRKVELAAVKHKEDELGQAQLDSSDAKERWQEESDREQLDLAAALCRGNGKERAHGRGYLLGLAAIGNDNPRIVELLDQMTQLEFGQTVADIRTAKAAGEDLPEVIEEVVVLDSPAITDGVEARLEVGEAEAETDDQRKEASDGDDQAPGDQGDPESGGGSSRPPGD